MVDVLSLNNTSGVSDDVGPSGEPRNGPGAVDCFNSCRRSPAPSAPVASYLVDGTSRVVSHSRPVSFDLVPLLAEIAS